jgi:hypothetical protein
MRTASSVFLLFLLVLASCNHQKSARTAAESKRTDQQSLPGPAETSNPVIAAPGEFSARPKDYDHKWQLLSASTNTAEAGDL